MQRDPIGYYDSTNFYQYTLNNPINFSDPSGLLVTAEYDPDTGDLSVTDYDTGQQITIPAESGGKPFGDSIPPGRYDILEHGRKRNQFRLDPVDEHRWNDLDDESGRGHFRLHGQGRGINIGCIGAKSDDDWDDVLKLIGSTSTLTVPDLFKPGWKFWGSMGNLSYYGTLVVKQSRKNDKRK